uniref:ATP-dependent DNA helicase n=1 Tax=Octopus bimaculoides TaxID=37653 RepID=A0A0L8G8H4_OCTBM
MTAYIADNEHKLLEDQLGVYKTTISSIGSERGSQFFLDALGGTGKTFVINLLLAKLHQMKHIAIAVASSGIAATLLSGSLTADSCFRLPSDLSKKEKANYNISCGSIKIKLLGECRQTFPVVPKATRADKSSVQKLRFTTNMRVQFRGDDVDRTFSKQLLDVGNGTSVGEEDGRVSLPFGHMVSDLKELMNKVFPNSRNQFTDHNWLKTRAILVPKNVTVDELNTKLLEQLPGEHHIYNSIDTVLNIDEAVNYPVEFLNSLTPHSHPPHNLHLKIGTPVMLLRNIDPPKLYNVLETTILTGKASGEPVFIPRIPLTPSDMPFLYKRLQLPLKLSFAMSINKTQGQSLNVVGLNLAEQVFSHGQLCVGCSRVGNPNHLFIYAPQGKTKNVVYQEALQI